VYCEILEEEETATTEEEINATEENNMAKTVPVEDRKYEEQNAHHQRDITLYHALNVERKEIIEIKAEPEKFQTNCCSIS
jgi:hypothetical protein